MFDNIRKNQDNDPTINPIWKLFFVTPNLHALWFHSIAHFLYKCKIPLIPRLLNLTSLDS